jgi:hypothetical protein
MRYAYLGANMRQIYLLISTFGLGASLVISGASAQSYPCNQSMITGSWVFIDQADLNTVDKLACTIAIYSTGSIESSISSCKISMIDEPLDSFVPMSGSLSIHPSCKVTGKINWSVSSTPKPRVNPQHLTWTYSFTSNLTLWRSLDGSRLTVRNANPCRVLC